MLRMNEMGEFVDPEPPNPFAKYRGLRVLVHEKAPDPATAVPCPVCGRPFEKKSANHRFCSRECRYAARDRAGCEPRPCAICGSEFTPRWKDARYCSDECRAEASRRRRRAAGAALATALLALCGCSHAARAGEPALDVTDMPLAVEQSASPALRDAIDRETAREWALEAQTEIATAAAEVDSAATVAPEPEPMPEREPCAAYAAPEMPETGCVQAENEAGERATATAAVDGAADEAPATMAPYGEDGPTREMPGWHDGRKETYYSSRVLPHYRMGEWTVDEEGFYRDSEGRYVVGVGLGEHEIGDTFEGGKGECVVMDFGCCEGVTDYYTNW